MGGRLGTEEMRRDFNDSRCSPTRSDLARLKQIAEGIASQPLAFHPVIPIICLPVAARKDPQRPKYHGVMRAHRDAIVLSQKIIRHICIKNTPIILVINKC